MRRGSRPAEPTDSPTQTGEINYCRIQNSLLNEIIKSAHMRVCVCVCWAQEDVSLRRRDAVFRRQEVVVEPSRDIAAFEQENQSRKRAERERVGGWGERITG